MQLLIFEKKYPLISVIASVLCEAIPCSISSFTRKFSVRLLRRGDHSPRNDEEVRLSIFNTQYAGCCTLVDHLLANMLGTR